jgi:hypothetical protein
LEEKKDMKKRLVYAFALVLGATTLGSIGSLRAAVRTQNVNIPYQFHVEKKALPSGEYRLEQEVGSEIATLINVKTGERIRVMRPAWRRMDGKVLFTLVPGRDGYTLKVS